LLLSDGIGGFLIVGQRGRSCQDEQQKCGENGEGPPHGRVLLRRGGQNAWKLGWKNAI